MAFQLINTNKYTHILAGDSSFGKDTLPRLSALFDCQPLSSVIEIVTNNEFKRPIYADNAIATVKSFDTKVSFIIRSS